MTFLYLDNFLWTSTWFLIAWQSFRDRNIGFPPFLLVPILAFDFCYFDYFMQFPTAPKILWLSSALWVVADTLSLIAMSLYNRDIRAFPFRGYFWLQAIAVFVASVGFFKYSARIGEHGIQDIGMCLVPIIAGSFFFDIYRRPQLEGRSLPAMITRLIAGQFTYTYLFSRARVLPTGLVIGLIVLTLIFDIAQLYLYFKLASRARMQVDRAA